MCSGYYIAVMLGILCWGRANMAQLCYRTMISDPLKKYKNTKRFNGLPPQFITTCCSEQVSGKATVNSWVTHHLHSPGSWSCPGPSVCEWLTWREKEKTEAAQSTLQNVSKLFVQLYCPGPNTKELCASLIENHRFYSSITLVKISAPK